MQNDSFRRGAWWQTCASVILAGALLGTTACDDEEKPPPEEGQLTPIAEKGLAIMPFEFDATGLTLAEKERIGTGSYLVNAVADCSLCHLTARPDGTTQHLSGGQAFRISAAGDVVYARNLTPDPDTGMKLTEDEFLETMRTGKDYKSENAEELLIGMPWFSFRWMTTEDLRSIYAYLKKIPAIRNPVPADSKGAAAAARPVPFPSMYTDGEVSRPLYIEDTEDYLHVEQGLAVQPLADPPELARLSAADRALYGRGSYLLNTIGNCSGCHSRPERTQMPGPNYLKVNTTKYLAGGEVFTAPPPFAPLLKVTRTMSANLVGADYGVIKKLTYEQFRQALAEGKSTRGSVTRPIGFPMSLVVENTKNMVEEDYQAIYTYLKNQVPRTGADDKQTQPPARYCAQDPDCNTAGGETCNTTTKECVGSACTQAVECGACQTCTSNKCTAPEASSSCLTNGI